ncbi:MAG: glycerophosphodiester phosphodiesterase family protein [Acidobacteriota bacterium]
MSRGGAAETTSRPPRRRLGLSGELARWEELFFIQRSRMARKIAPMLPRPLLHALVLSGAVLATPWRLVAAADLPPSPPVSRPETIAGFMAAYRPMMIAHRGFSGQAPENTLVAVRQAIEVGADMVEVDVTRTADGDVILLHDETLDRTTDGTGRALDTPFAMIRRLDAGSWFSPRYAGEPVPTLAELLELTRGKILVNIEIKGEAVTDTARGGISQAVAELVAAHEMVDQVIVSSFDPRALAQLRDLAAAGVVPRLVTGSLYAIDLHQDQTPDEIAGDVGASAFHIGVRHVHAEHVADAHEAGLLVAVYTVNRQRMMRHLLDLGVDAFFTDHPDRLLDVLTERR